MKMLEGKIIKAVGGFFYVSHNGKTIPAKVRKKLSYNNTELTVGDNIGFCFDEYKKAVIETLTKRKNILTRPSVANVDVAVIVIAPIPQPDFVLVDKIILNCYIQNIQPLLVINKCDILQDNFINSVKAEYNDAVSRVLTVSAEAGYNLESLKEALQGKTSVFCGQSAVGKTSLLNHFTQKAQRTGEISQKSGRGKHTTRHSQIFEAEKDTYIVDTPGFSLLELDGIKSSQLNLYYSDMVELQSQCKYHMCTHTTEPDCFVKSCVADGSFNKNRYERYLAIFEELKEAEKNKF